MIELREFLEEIPDALYVHDLEGRILDVNRRACESLGYSRPELLSLSLFDLVPTLSLQDAQAIWLQMSPGERTQRTSWHRRKNGTLFPVEVHLSLALNAGKKIIMALAHDITRRKQDEERQLRLRNLYHALSEVNQAIVRMDEETVLFPLVCRMAVEYGGVKMAWIGQENPENGLIQPVAAYGNGMEYLDGIVISVDPGIPEGRGPTARAYRDLVATTVDDFLHDEMTAPWRDRALFHDFGAIATFPISRKGQPFAVFTVYSDTDHPFDQEMFALLEELSKDIIFSLNNFDREYERRRTEEQLRVSEEKFSTVFRSSPIPIWITSQSGYRLLDVNQAWAELSGFAEQEALGQSMIELGLLQEHSKPWSRIKATLESAQTVKSQEIVFTRYGGETATCLVSIERIHLHDEHCLVWMAQDISALIRAVEIIDQKNNFLNAIFENEPHCVKVVSPQGQLLEINRAGLDILEINNIDEARHAGFHHFLLPGYQKPFAELLHKTTTGTGGSLEFQIMGKKGTKRWLETHTAPIQDSAGKVIAVIGVTQDITEKKQSDELIWKQANFDLLTGLPNRHMFYDRLEHEIKKAHRGSSGLALFFIDLDRFKEVNDSLGHLMGDNLLVEAAQRINRCVRESDTVARLGGDEFTVILSQIDDTSRVDAIAQYILESLSEPFSVGGEHGKIYISASIGITLYPGDSHQIEQLLRNADQAMYAAKKSGRNRFCYFTPVLQEKATTRLRLFNELKEAIQREQFTLHFQPILNLSSREIIKAEALVRWNHPTRGLVGPAEFIPLAEDTGLIVDIGTWVFQETTRWVSRWIARYPALRVSVNMSPSQFILDDQHFSGLLDHLENIPLKGDHLIIEITESLLLDAQGDVIQRLEAFRKAGIQVGIDDFGTGYSALSYLQKFQLDYLKIDQSFIQNLANSPGDMALCEAIIVMAHKLGLQVIAEGVETKAQETLLSHAGCDYAQGYLYSVPIPGEQFEALLGSTIQPHSQPDPETPVLP